MVRLIHMNSLPPRQARPGDDHPWDLFRHAVEFISDHSPSTWNFSRAMYWILTMTTINIPSQWTLTNDNIHFALIQQVHQVVTDILLPKWGEPCLCAWLFDSIEHAFVPLLLLQFHPVFIQFSLWPPPMVCQPCHSFQYIHLKKTTVAV